MSGMREAVRDRLIALMDGLEAARNRSPRDLWRAALDIEHVVLSDLLTPDEEDAVIADPGIAARLSSCQGVFAPLESWIELSMARVMKQSGAGTIWAPDNVSQHYIARYEHLAAAEIELSGMRGEDRVLFIGSGPLPITALEYARQTGCTVDCVDFVPEAIECSRDIAESLGLANRIRCFRNRGELHDPSPYDVILVGVLAAPKQAIMNHLDRNVKPGCRLICRTTYGLRQLIYQRARWDAGELTRLVERDRSVARGDRVISAQLLAAS